MIVDARDGMMERLLADAGIAAGMRVLDLGCGHGNVAQMIARRVGDGGRVVGVDRDPRALATAREAAAARGFGNVTFVEADLHLLGALPEARAPFDAAVGRRVLMYQPDAAAALRAVAAVVRPGGAVALQEVDASMVPASSAELPLHRRVHGWVWQMVAREGGTLTMGLQLTGAMERAGVTVADVRAEAVVQTAARRLPTAAMVRAVLPRIVERGVATPEEVDVDTLDQRLEDELRVAAAAYVGDMVFSAWGRV
jgi:ubiquinone/menaquinone biosynthesis C-methylase UbiE